MMLETPVFLSAAHADTGDTAWLLAATALLGALVVGLVAGVVCSYAVSWKFRLNYDDSLDVVGVHLVGGIIGTDLIGLFAEKAMTGGAEGLFHGGGLAQLGRQAVAVVAVAAYAFGVTYGIGKLIDKAMGSRASEEQEHTGLDLTVHAETAYDHGVLGHGAPVSSSVLPAAQKVKSQV